jgi:hypothetical protein
MLFEKVSVRFFISSFNVISSKEDNVLNGNKIDNEIQSHGAIIRSDISLMQ